MALVSYIRIVICILLLCTVQAIAQTPLSGNYTIGGTGASFSSFSAAVTSLKTNGIGASVVFKVRPGTYVEQIELPAITGASCTRSVTFESENGSAGSVILTYTPPSGLLDYVVYLNGGDGIRFRNVTLQSESPFSSRVVAFVATGSDCATFEGCIMQCLYAEHDIIIAEASKHTTFENNIIRKGNRGITLRPNGSSFGTHAIIRNNTFEGQRYGGIDAQYQDSLIVEGNRISATTTTFYRGMEFSRLRNGYHVIGNKVTMDYGTYGIYLVDCAGTPANPALVANNFVSLRKDNTAQKYALELYDLTDVGVYHNSIHIGNDQNFSGASASLYTYSGRNVDIRNNIFSNSSGGYSMEIRYAGTTVVGDYNDLYTTGSAIGFWNADRADLSAWRSASNWDANSLSVRPFFTSHTDLHVAQPDLNGKGTSLASVKTDIDGQTRNATAPDIGADEFTPSANDAGVTAVLGPTVPFLHGVRPVSARIKNYGTSPLTQIKVKRKITENGTNAVQEFAWSGSLASGATAEVSLGTFDFKINTKYDLTLWTEMPNATTDVLAANDTAKLREVYAGVAGTYTIGGANPAFVDFSSAVNTLNRGGITDNVVFKVRNGTYTERIQIDPFPGGGCSRSVTFESEGGAAENVTLIAPASYQNNYVVYLHGGDGVRFKNITMRSEEGGYYDRVILLDNRSDCITITGCKLIGGNNYDLTVSTNSIDNRLLIENNVIQRGNRGISLVGSYSDHESGAVIRNNIFEGQRGGAMYVQYQDSLRIENNRITATAGTYGYRAIDLESLANGYVVVKNKITTENGQYGIYLNNCNGTMANPALVANNFISLGMTADDYYSRYGTYIYSSNDVNIYYNTIHVGSSQNFSTTSASVYNYYSQRLNIRNNIFLNSAGGYCLYFAYSSYPFVSDYNNLYTTGVNLVSSSGNHTTLDAWKTASGQDGHSKNVDPLFVSQSDLHVNQVALNGAATPLPAVTDDIDGQARDNLTPDIGADEFSNTSRNLALDSLVMPATGCGLTSGQPVKIKIINLGGQAETGFAVSYQVDNAAPVTENVGTLSVLAGQAAYYTFQTKANLSATRAYVIKTYLSSAADQNRVNDTLSNQTITNIAPVLPVTLGVPADKATGVPVYGASFSWSASPSATAYDFYVWADGQPEPTKPLRANLTEINIEYSFGYTEYFKTYHWRVTSRNTCSQATSPTFSFTTVGQPDLAVDTIQTPAVAMAGQEIEIAWRIKNKGTAHTGDTKLYDRIYLSKDRLLDFEWEMNPDVPLGLVEHAGGLDGGQTYTEHGTFTLPIYPTVEEGNYYIIVYANYNGGGLDESDYDNNAGASAAPMQITLLSPPDLKVTQVVAPSNVFSGETRTISWTVKNHGTGVTAIGNWSDNVYFSRSAEFNEDSVIAQYQVAYSNGALKPDSSYTQTYTLQVPPNISGTYYVHVMTDLYHEVHEYGANGEDNNILASDPMTVFLTPPGDLVVSELIVPANLDATKNATIQWTVRNQGTSTTVESLWMDKVYLSTSPEFNVNTATILHSQFHAGALPAEATYTVKADIALPCMPAGAYYLFVITDANGQVFEFGTSEDNNIKRSTGTLALNLPDLTVTEVTIPATISHGAPFTVNWKLKNDGAGAIAGRGWYDRVYISSSSVFDAATATEVASLYHASQSLAAGGSRSDQMSVSLPASFSGQGFVYVVTDQYNNLCESNNDNNLQRSVAPFTTAPSDIAVQSVTVPATATAGQSVTVQWLIKNNGPNISQVQWTDNVFISPNENLTNAILLGAKTYTAVISGNSSYQQSLSVNIPQGLEGKYFICVKTDGYNVLEEADETNNQGCSDTPITLLRGATADLQVTALSVSTGTIAVGRVLEGSFTVTNKGTAVTSAATWTDRIYVSYQPTWAAAYSMLLQETTHESALTKGQTYTVPFQGTIPFNLSSGTYYIYAVTDVSDQVIEITGEGNNTTRSNAITIQGQPPADLAVAEVSHQTTGFSGKPVTVTWRVLNSGNNAVLAASWLDAIYLSKDNIFDPNADVLLTQWTQGNALGEGGAYTQNKSLTLPEGISGTYYLFVVADLYNANNDRDLSNNRKTLVSNNTPVPITITLSPSSDLQVTNLTTANGVSGQPLRVVWRVENNGQATAPGQWTDRVYLSTNNTIDESDIKLGASVRNTSLAKDGSYETDVSFVVPSVVSSGNYFVLVRTDDNDVIFEYQGEQNNIAAKDIFISQPLASDLRISRISDPSNMMLGETIKIKWQTTNQGVNPSTGRLQEAFYISGDTILDKNDILLRNQEKNIALASQQSIADSLTERVTRIPQGEYYILAVTDILNNILEDDETNNISFSAHTLQVRVSELSLNVQTKSMLANEQELYYRIEIPASLQGESLVITLKGDSSQGNNEIYLRYGDVPSRSVHDVAQSNPFQGNQEVTIASLKEGTYYLMVYGKTPIGIAQEISLYADILEFAVSKVEANSGGNTGLVTVKISGAKFLGTTQFSLVNTFLQEVIYASKVHVTNPTTVFATFYLAGKREAVYDVQARNVNLTATLDSAFTIVPGVGGDDGTGSSPGGVMCVITPLPEGEGLLIDGDSPETVRLNRMFSFLVRYENQGNIDVPAPTRFLVSLHEIPIGLTVEDVADDKHELLVELKEQNGPPAVLRPGARGEIRVYSKSVGNLIEYILLE